MKRLISFIDRMNRAIGKLNSLLVLPLVAIVLYEIVMRYVFNAPTIWGFEMTAFVFGAHYMLGLAMTEEAKGHVRVEILPARFGPRAQAWFGIIGYAVLFVPVFLLMSYAAGQYAWSSLSQSELNPTSWAPPIWPVKIIMALGFVLLFLQGLNTLLKKLQVLRDNA